MNRSHSPTLWVRSVLCAALGVLLAGCASVAAAPVKPAETVAQAGPTPPMPTPPARAASAAAPAASAAALPGSPPASTSPPFATVIRDAKKTDGLFTLWQKDERVWIELKPEDFNKPFYLSPKLARGIGESWIFGGSMIVPGSRIEERIVEFRKVHNLVQLVALNSEFLPAAGKTPEARAIASSYAPSLLSSVGVASAPHPERKTILIDAGALLLNDMLGVGAALQRAFRQGYTLEGRNTHFAAVRGSAEHVVFDINAHYYTPNIATPQAGAPPGTPMPSAPRNVPDPRSLYLGLYVAFSKLPDTPMAPRLADARIGSFNSVVYDFGSDTARTPRVRYVQRWRLEKKDPAAALSEPVKPITYWLDRTIPLQYRDTITRAILEWTKAFEKIGFKDAIAVQVQPDDADWDTLDVNRASVRWMTNASPIFGAIGPSHVDPRTGEILDADIGIESLTSRSMRAARARILGDAAGVDWARLLQRPALQALDSHAGHGHAAEETCLQAELGAEQLSYALDVLAARGEVDPAGPEAQQFVLDYLFDVTMHEVGHTLGLRHNFRASRVLSDRQISDREYTRKNALSGSVMEYLPINLSRPGERGGMPFQATLGTYDYWAIEYLYKPFAPAEEAAELKRIAARSGEPELAYATDEDAFIGIDPEALQMDLGDDPVAFAEKRIAIARDLVARQESRTLSPDSDYAILRRSVNYAVFDAARAAGILARQIGGVRTLRDHPGSGRDPLVPVPAATQRKALDVLARGVLASDAFRLSPSLQRKLAPDFADRGDAPFSAATDYSITGIVVGLQRALLGQLMSDGVATLLLDSEGKFDKDKGGKDDAFRLSELYTRLTSEVWSELGAAAVDIPGPRRELQREHVNRVATLLLRPSPTARADARSLLRVQAQGLLGRINTAAKRPSLSAEARAHLQDTAETLQQALAAKLIRPSL
ncbi:MAG TPA: zinc-dependent metalloprotease [Burkholderiaceae bacterium]|nr:zinc-dependent metalloprotease [Burkholderiaceae bacterium]